MPALYLGPYKIRLPRSTTIRFGSLISEIGYSKLAIGRHEIACTWFVKLNIKRAQCYLIGQFNNVSEFSIVCSLIFMQNIFNKPQNFTCPFFIIDNEKLIKFACPGVCLASVLSRVMQFIQRSNYNSHSCNIYILTAMT